VLKQIDISRMSSG